MVFLATFACDGDDSQKVAWDVEISSLCVDYCVFYNVNGRQRVRVTEFDRPAGVIHQWL